MLHFTAPRQTLRDLDAESAASVIAAAADVVLVLDTSGVILDMAFGSEELANAFEARRGWLGRPWAETVTEESRIKVAELLAEAAHGKPTRWRHVNQQAPGVTGVPLLFSAMRIGPEKRRVIVASGRDLRPMSALQQRLVQAQQAIERDYARLRHAETRYRLLFQMSAEPVLIVDAETLRVTEANLSADRLLGGEGGASGRTLLESFDTPSQGRIRGLLATVRATGRGEEMPVRLAAGEREATLSASLVRNERELLYMLRLSFPASGSADIVLPQARSRMLEFVDSAPDAFVIAGTDGRILAANAAFLDMTQLASEAAARGLPLSRFLGRQGVELEVLMANVRSRGPVRLFRTALRGEHGTSAEVEVSAVAVLDGGQPGFGFTIRDVGPRLAESGAPGEVHPLVPRPAQQLTELVGRVPLKELVREATDVIERLAIEAALELSGDNRASAAEMLGLSRQSLYVKLRRYGLGDLDSDDGGDA